MLTDVNRLTHSPYRRSNFLWIVYSSKSPAGKFSLSPPRAVRSEAGSKVDFLLFPLFFSFTMTS